MIHLNISAISTSLLGYWRRRRRRRRGGEEEELDAEMVEEEMHRCPGPPVAGGLSEVTERGSRGDC